MLCHNRPLLLLAVSQAVRHTPLQPTSAHHTSATADIFAAAASGCVAGGETMILQPQLLGSFWQSFSPNKGLELRDLVTLVEPRFNQLTGVS
jgi:hypothetical protein